MSLGNVVHAFRLPALARTLANGSRMVSTTSSTSVALFKRLSEFPTYRSAQFQSNNVIRASTTILDYERIIKRQSVTTFVVGEKSVSKALSPDVSEIIASQLSPSGRHLAILRETTDASSPASKKRYVEVWSEERVLASEEVTHIHGAFYTDEYLSSISFSPSEGKLAYVAEGKAPESSDSDPLVKYRFVPEFGESYSGKKRTTIFVFNWANVDKSTTSVQPLALVEEPEKLVLLAHPVFAEEDKLFAAGYEYAEDGRLLGVIHCPNRPVRIWELSLPPVEPAGDALSCTGSKITAAALSCRSPRVLRRDSGPDLLVWLSNAVGGPHASCTTLHAKDLTSGKETNLVESVWDPEPDAFPGLYVNTLPVYPFLNVSGSHYVVLSSTWRSRSTTLLVSLENGKVTELTPNDGEYYSWTVLCTDGKDQVVCTRSAPSRPPELVLGKVAKDGKATWRILAQPELGDDLRQKLDRLSTVVVPVPNRHPLEVLVVRTGAAASAPCITIPHGGPHGASVTTFSAWTATIALEGYTVAMPNYTGSVGFGEKFIRKLLGQIGSLDVEDCVASVRHLVASGVCSDGPGRQFLHGGSHGGFLIGHLVGQYPNMFGAGVLRNPVISLGEISTSDIPDWYYEESGLSFAAKSIITPETYEKLFSMSPIAHIDAVQTPLVIIIGEKDQRVAPTQGRNYYHALKARGKEVDLLCLKDDIHAIDSVEGQLATYEAAKRLFDSVVSKN